MEKITLKKIVTHSNKNVIILIMTGVFMAIYGVCGAISNQTGAYLPLLDIEKTIPLMPWTILIYIILYPGYLVYCLYSYKNEVGMNKTLIGFVILTLISAVIFLVFPTKYPRYLYPLPMENDPLTMLLRAVRVIDKPSNALPSLHVAICYIFGLGFYRENKTKFLIAMLISSIVAVSTLTTKQHYIYDIALGLFLSWGIWFAMDRWIHIKSDN